MNRLLASVLLLSMALAGSAIGAPDPNNLRGLSLGRYVYLKYCAGCHGQDGFALFPPAPSFALGERLERSDALLMRSIEKGIGGMPSWEDKLPRPWLRQSLRFIRRLAADPDRPPRGSPRSTPEFFYIFAPPGTDPTGEWTYLP